ncbi:MAG: transcriptional repressor NrdR [Candidatus Eremiobacteraeota bacterium]|nr:transcriptional repressor NrdR [Candidatus Eremiobacteraeota bacterium]
MRCPRCNGFSTHVLDTRSIESGYCIRRRRECLKCGHRFTTYERFKPSMIMVIKKSNKKEKFNIKKIIRGIQKACTNLNIDDQTIEKMAREIESEIRAQGKKEVDSLSIGTLTLEKLKRLNEVAYLRFASVHKMFERIESFLDEVKHLEEERRKKHKRRKRS